jgi:hypothetical protein
MNDFFKSRAFKNIRGETQETDRQDGVKQAQVGSKVAGSRTCNMSASTNRSVRR